jgi:hypothetical protein
MATARRTARTNYARRRVLQRLAYAALPALGAVGAHALETFDYPISASALAVTSGALAVWLLWIQLPNAIRRSWWLGAELPHRPEPISFLRYRAHRYAKLALIVCATSVLAYARSQESGTLPGDSPVGYTLGLVAAGVMLWLAAYALRKRRRAASGAPLRAWLSAHVYLGCSLLVLVPLHCGFEFGWNLHGFAAAVTGLAVLTGFVATANYLRLPAFATLDAANETRESRFSMLAGIDRDLARHSSQLPDALARSLSAALQEGPDLRGAWTTLLRGVHHEHTTRAISALRGVEGTTSVLELLSSRETALRAIARQQRFQALLQAWVVLHIPLSYAALAAVAVHVFAVTYYR